MNGTETRQYVLLPRTGVRAVDPAARAILEGLPVVSSTGDSRSVPLDVAGGRDARILDAISEDGPRLVELDDEGARLANDPGSPVRAVPIVTYDRPNPPLSASAPAQPAAGFSAVTLECQDADTGDPVAGAKAVAFTDFPNRRGDSGVSDGGGQIRLELSGTNIERLYVYPPQGYWGAFQRSVAIAPTLTVDLAPVELDFVDAVRQYYADSRFDGTRGVTVGVLDSGVGPHVDLNIGGGSNTVTGEPASQWEDPDGHGTHVAGLVGSNSAPPVGLRGVAPGVELRAYRVFPGTGGGATNYAILKAMIFAAADGCDIINLSLGGGPFDWLVQEAVQDAREQGMLVVVAAGNDGRKPVSYPAAYNEAVAISAMGREGSFPAGSLDESAVLRPPFPNIDPQEFIADFSNVGPQIAATGLGVGVVSTLPNNSFGPMSGTSMAAPVVAGCVASLLSQDGGIFSMPRDSARSRAIERLLLTSCVRRGFGSNFEGFGLPDPGVV